MSLLFLTSVVCYCNCNLLKKTEHHVNFNNRFNRKRKFNFLIFVFHTLKICISLNGVLKMMAYFASAVHLQKRLLYVMEIVFVGMQMFTCSQLVCCSLKMYDELFLFYLVCYSLVAHLVATVGNLAPTNHFNVDL